MMKKNDSSERAGFENPLLLKRYNMVKNYVMGKYILDVACGNGFGTEILAEIGAKKVMGIDRSKLAIKFAKSNSRTSKIEYKQLDFKEIDKLPDKFDVIIVFEFIEHLDENEQIELIDLVKVKLRKYGVLILSTPNRKMTIIGKNPYHKREVDEKELKKLLINKFDEVDLWGIDCKNRRYKEARKNQKNSSYERLLGFLFSFKIINKLDNWMPRVIKKTLIGERRDFNLKVGDYKLVNNLEEAEMFLAIAKK